MFTHIRTCSRVASSTAVRLNRIRSLQTRVTPAISALQPSHRSSLRHYSQDAPKAQKFEFQAETRNLLDIVAKSLYSDQEVFIRELISNASDALEKRRCAELTKDSATSVLGDEVPYEIRISTNAETSEMSFEDTGIGMNREELISCLGTIARSGSKDFKENSEAKSAESIIGQFGVGFYSAFMVAESVKVTTRKEGAATGYTWIWDGASAYEISENDSAPIGTKIDLKLRSGDASEFSKAEKVLEVINKYSYFVNVPIILNGERVNEMNAIWTMTPKDVTSEMHENFFKQLARTHHPHLLHDRPQYTVHYKADAPVNLRSILYIPSHKVSQLEFTANSDDSGVSLYARKVLIKAHAKELLPSYLRFVIGVVDSEDIPLNLSREMLQRDVVLVKLRRILTDKVVNFLVQQMKKDRIKYNDFYKGYSLYFKEGICLETDQGIKEQISKMLLFESSNFKAGTMTSLSEYVERMQADQKEIYYLFAPSRQLAENSPYYEMFKSRNLEVLFVYDPADELVFLSLPQFQMKQLKSVENWVKTEGGLLEDKKEENVIRSAEKKELLDWIKSNLGSVRVNEIDASSRASEHPAMITTGAADLGAARHLMRIGQIKDMEHLVYLKPKLHINLNHSVILGLLKLKKTDEKLALLVVEQIYDNALITAGLMKDSSKMISRVNRIMGDLLNQNKSTILTP
ncbi:hypothetical protein QR680_012573 [Steinernema hermaphroditum]|uniref:Histidine kinase/HSP90-like ATPase domain-containing protein n=1 Tax=Steinernema hermaphroditum TaxID=289476 RepID=A0AA39M015_9BILA|nr:hypothetical protein QR680_012573 [Steinernema hermaphroditum]